MFVPLLSILALLGISSTVSAATCTARNGLGGVCISTSACRSGGGVSDPANLCPGGNDIQCCTYGYCTSNGQAGTCIPTGACSGGGGRSNSANLCPGGNDIQCCTYGSCTSNGNAGQCIPTPKCGGTSNPANICPGPSNIQCCTSGGGGGGGGVAGLNPTQTAHARKIAAVAHSSGVGLRGCWVGFVTAITESNIKVYANQNIPESFNYPHDAVGSDHRSVGIFQQQVPGWGTVRDCMDPTTSAQKFFDALKRISNWQSLSVGQAAQKVQVSAFPDRYQTHLGEAQNICAALF
ncbi:hypothetical protein HK104_005297 [Borealophlyctis nickersoniae]|nr:hypothetical protein HK104_005297 [Borealophlyctis nickersoniae]